MDDQRHGDTHRIYVVDDHPLLRRAIRGVIETEANWKAAGESSTPSEAQPKLLERPPGMIITDLMFPGESGLGFLEFIRHQLPSTRTLVFSGLPEHAYAERCLKAGAMGFVRKDATIGTLKAAMGQVLAGRRWLSPSLADAMVERALGNGAKVGGVDPTLLSERELEVFQLIGQGFTTRRIAQTLHRSIKTIETYRYRIKKKLAIEESIHLAQAAARFVESSV